MRLFFAKKNLMVLIILLTRLTQQELRPISTRDVIVRVWIYVGGAITGSCADTDVAQSGALGRCQGQLKQKTRLCSNIDQVIIAT